MQLPAGEVGAFKLATEATQNSMYRLYLESINAKGDILYLDASNYNPIYGNSNIVQPPAITIKYIVKY